MGWVLPHISLSLSVLTMLGAILEWVTNVVRNVVRALRDDGYVEGGRVA